MINRGKGSVRLGNMKPLVLEHAEGLRASHFVDQVKRDEQLVLTTVQLPHNMIIPYLVVKVYTHNDSRLW